MLIVDTTMKYKHQLVKIDKKNSKQPAGNLKPHAKFFWNHCAHVSIAHNWVRDKIHLNPMTIVVIDNFKFRTYVKYSQGWQSLWQRANTRNVNFEILDGGWLTLSTQFIDQLILLHAPPPADAAPKFPDKLPLYSLHWLSVSLTQWLTN